MVISRVVIWFVRSINKPKPSGTLISTKCLHVFPLYRSRYVRTRRISQHGQQAAECHCNIMKSCKKLSGQFSTSDTAYVRKQEARSAYESYTNRLQT